MGIFDGISNLFDTAVSDVTGIFSGQPDMGGSYLNAAPSDILSYQYPVAYGTPVMGDRPPTLPPPLALPQQALTSIITNVPKWASAFPNLWGYVSRFKRPARVVAQLLNFLGRFGPVALSALVGAQLVSELFAYKVTHKKRRMNPANSRALRRSLRRLKSFDRLCHRVNGQLHRSGRRAPTRRCGRCRKSPCAC